MSIRLYVGNLPKEPIEREELQAVFADAGDQVSTKVIKDRKTGKCRGFAFVTVPTDEIADALIEKHNGQPFKEVPLKIEKALPRSKSKGNEEGAQGESSPKAAPNKKNNKRARRNSNASGSNYNQEASQPDPRWANELAKLKEMLAAQANNS